MARAPSWIQICPSTQKEEPALEGLDDGEKAVVHLARFTGAGLLLIDVRRAVKVARNMGFRVAGMLAVLGMAAKRDLLVLAESIEVLKQTNFHCRQEIFDQFLAEQDSER